jgi:conjugal transfer pilin signal peptidase TrbI
MQLNPFKTMHWVFAGIGGLIGILAGILVMWPKPLPLLVVDMNRAIEAPSVMLARSKLTHEEQWSVTSGNPCECVRISGFQTVPCGCDG